MQNLLSYMLVKFHQIQVRRKLLRAFLTQNVMSFDTLCIYCIMYLRCCTAQGLRNTTSHGRILTGFSVECHWHFVLSKSIKKYQLQFIWGWHYILHICTGLMMFNTDKCNLLIWSYRHEHTWADVGEDKIWESIDVKLLGTKGAKIR